MRKSEYFKRHTYTPNEFYNVLARMEDAMSGDVATANIIPAEVDKFEPAATPASGDPGPTYTITIQAENSNGDILTWYNRTHEIEVVVTADDGNVSINGGSFGSNNTNVDADIDFVNGVATFTITLGGAWAAADKVEITCPKTDIKILGEDFQVTTHEVIGVVAD